MGHCAQQSVEWQRRCRSHLHRSLPQILHSENVHAYLPAVAEEINWAEQYLLESESDTDDLETTNPECCQEEWMLLC